MSGKVPSLADFVSALVTVKEYLMEQLRELSARFPDQAERLQKVAEFLASKGDTLEALNVVLQEIQALGGGPGPVVHDDVDLA